MRRYTVFVIAVVATAMPDAGLNARQPAGRGRNQDPNGARKNAIDKAIAYFKSHQANDGTWSKAASPGITGIVLSAMLRNGVSPDDPTVAKGLKFIESLADPKTGHLAGAGAAQSLQLHDVREFDGPEARQS